MHYPGTILTRKGYVFNGQQHDGDYGVCARMEVELTAEDAGVQIEIVGAFCLVFF